MANATRRMEIKREQRRVIETSVSEKDVFFSLPTGYGKSGFTTACRGGFREVHVLPP